MLELGPGQTGHIPKACIVFKKICLNYLKINMLVRQKEGQGKLWLLIYSPDVHNS